MPSNDKDGINDELQAIEDAKQVIEDPNSTEEEKEEAQQVVAKAEAKNKEAEAAKAERKEKAYQDQLKAETAKVANGEKELKDVPEWLKEEVEARISKLAPKKETTDEDKLLEKLEARQELKSIKELLTEEEDKEFQAEIDDLQQHGYTLMAAITKTKKQFGILSDSEREQREQANGMRVIPAGRTSLGTHSTDFKKKEDSYMATLPDFIKKIPKK